MRVPLQIFEFTCRLAAWQHDAVDVPCLLSVPLARLAEMADIVQEAIPALPRDFAQRMDLIGVDPKQTPFRRARGTFQRALNLKRLSLDQQLQPSLSPHPLALLPWSLPLLGVAESKAGVERLARHRPRNACLFTSGKLAVELR